MKKTLIILSGFLLLNTIGLTSAFTIDGSTELQIFNIDNINYIINTSMDFSKINHSSNTPTDITFNNTFLFNVSAPNPMNITIIQLSSQQIRFYANTTTGNVYFNITGLQNNKQYRIDRNGTTLTTRTTDNTGTIRFNNNAWSQRYFEIYSLAEAEEETPPSSNRGADEKPETKAISNDTLILMVLILIILIIAIAIIFFK